jgi:hypothetical protein
MDDQNDTRRSIDPVRSRIVARDARGRSNPIHRRFQKNGPAARSNARFDSSRASTRANERSMRASDRWMKREMGARTTVGFASRAREARTADASMGRRLR